MVRTSNRNNSRATVNDVDNTVNASHSTRGPRSNEASQMQRDAPDPDDDDEVVTCSPRSFYEAKERATATRSSRAVEEVDDGSLGRTSSGPYSDSKKYLSKRRVIYYTPVSSIINLEDSDEEDKDKAVAKGQATSQSAPPPEPPTLSCPICLGPFVEEMSTKCGHIFCKECITTALASQKKCPSCSRKLRKNSIFRVYLPGLQ